VKRLRQDVTPSVAIGRVAIAINTARSISIATKEATAAKTVTSQAKCRHVRPARAIEGLVIGIVGGSITWGAELGKDKLNLRWSGILNRRLPNSTVMNRAFPATGVSIPSFCLESPQVLPDATTLDVLVVEYSFNDLLGHSKFTAKGSNGPNSSPQAGLERLILRVLAHPKPPLIVILVVCANSKEPTGIPRCESLFHEVAAHYRTAGVVEVSLMRDGPQLGFGTQRVQRSASGNIDWYGMWYNGTHHPHAPGHERMATLVQNVIQNHVTKTSCADLPKTKKWVGQSELKSSWQCQICGLGEMACPSLDSIASNPEGFLLQKTSRSGGKYGASKLGWLATDENSTIRFNIDGGKFGANLMLANLCSFQKVGVLDVYVTKGRSPQWGSERPHQRIELKWARRSTQQCLNFLDKSTPPGASQLWLRVASNRSAQTQENDGNQVALYGIYTQLLEG